MKSTIHRIKRKFGRRTYDRFSIPGATVAWTYLGQDFVPDETLPLSDISMKGLSLLANNPPEVDSDISIRIHLPKEPGSLELAGKVIYSINRGPNLTFEYRVGVELKPFSKTEGDNSPQSQEIIEELEQMYGKRLEQQEDIED